MPRREPVEIRAGADLSKAAVASVNPKPLDVPDGLRVESSPALQLRLRDRSILVTAALLIALDHVLKWLDVSPSSRAVFESPTHAATSPG